MYINFKLLVEKGILMSELTTLIAINQKDTVYLKSIPFDSLEEDDLITYVKGTAPKEERVRLSKNGKALLDALTTKGATEESLALVTDLVDLYEHYGKETGNVIEIRDRINWFIGETGFSARIIKSQVENYLSERSEYTLRLDNLIWKPQSSAFSSSYNLSDSRLFELIRRKYNLPINFYLKESGKRKRGDIWLYDIMKLKVPKGLNSECYWTNSEEGDREALKRLQKKFREIE